RTYLPWASITRSAGGSSASGPIAAILPPSMAIAASKTSVEVTIRPPRTIVSTRGAVIGSPECEGRRFGGCASALKRSSVRLLLDAGVQQRAVVLGLAPAEEVPPLAHGMRLVEVDPRHDQLVARGRRLRDHLAERVDDGSAADQLHAVFHTGLGHAHYE